MPFISGFLWHAVQICNQVSWRSRYTAALVPQLKQCDFSVPFVLRQKKWSGNRRRQDLLPGTFFHVSPMSSPEKYCIRTQQIRKWWKKEDIGYTVGGAKPVYCSQEPSVPRRLFGKPHAVVASGQRFCTYHLNLTTIIMVTSLTVVQDVTYDVNKLSMAYQLQALKSPPIVFPAC